MKENALKAGIGLIESIPQHQRTVAQDKTLAGAKEKLENYKNILRTQKLHQEGKENLNKNNEEKINHIDPDEVISGMWEDSLNNLKKNVEKSRFKSVEKTDESGIINYNEKAFDVNLLPKQVHHFITNKNLKYTPKFNKIVSNYGLHLNGSWNKMEMNHLGRHPNAYHQYILKHIYKIDKKAKGNTKKFIREFDKIKKEILDNPYMLRKDYWRDKENEIL